MTYLESADIYQKNLKSKNIIKALCAKEENNFSTDFSSVEIFDHLTSTSMMLLPAPQRPSASELKEIFNELTVYFSENTAQNINFAENILENIAQEKEKNQMASLLQKQNDATSSFPSELTDPFSSSKFTEKEADLLIRKNYLADPTVYLQDLKKRVIQ